MVVVWCFFRISFSAYVFHTLFIDIVGLFVLRILADFLLYLHELARFIELTLRPQQISDFIMINKYLVNEFCE